MHAYALACTHVLFHAYTCCGMHILLWHAYTAVACIHVLWHMYMCCGMHTHAVTCIHVLWHACMHCCGMHTWAVACIHVLWHAHMCCGMHTCAMACTHRHLWDIIGSCEAHGSQWVWLLSHLCLLIMFPCICSGGYAPSFNPPTPFTRS